jgi:hypothetical protein
VSRPRCSELFPLRASCHPSAEWPVSLPSIPYRSCTSRKCGRERQKQKPRPRVRTDQPCHTGNKQRGPASRVRSCERRKYSEIAPDQARSYHNVKRRKSRERDTLTSVSFDNYFLQRRQQRGQPAATPQRQRPHRCRRRSQHELTRQAARPELAPAATMLLAQVVEHLPRDSVSIGLDTSQRPLRNRRPLAATRAQTASPRSSARGG